MRQLHWSTEKCTPLQIEGGYNTFKSIENPEEEWKDIYMEPSSRIFEAVDSYHLSGQNLYMFQITCASSHEVKVNGLLKLLEMIGKKDEVFREQIKMHLVFVVPKGRAFVKLKIVFEEYHVANLKGIPGKEVKGVGRKTCGQLKDMGIENAQQQRVRGRRHRIARLQVQIYEFYCYKFCECGAST